jgi:hypothetical protein
MSFTHTLKLMEQLGPGPPLPATTCRQRTEPGTPGGVNGGTAPPFLMVNKNIPKNLVNKVAGPWLTLCVKVVLWGLEQ